MSYTRIVLRAAWLVCVLSATLLHSLPAQQTALSPTSTQTVKQFFQDLVDHYDPSTASQWGPNDVLTAVGNQIYSTATSDQMSDSLPAIFHALDHEDDNVKLKAAYALFLIAQRKDGTQLLRKYVNAIAALYNSSNKQLQATPNMIFHFLLPPPPEVLPLMLTFVSRTDRETMAQSGAVSVLMHAVPGNPQVLASLEHFMSRPLDAESRINTLGGIKVARLRDIRTRNVVIASLGETDKNVRLAAIEVLANMGNEAVLEAEQPLRKMIQNSAETAEVREAATKALRRIGF